MNVMTRGVGAPQMAFDPIKAKAICDALADSNLGLFALLKSRSDFPDWQVAKRWERENPLFAEGLSYAREAQLERMAESLVPLADEARGQPVEVNAIKLQVSTRQWLLSKLAAQTYGDKLDLTSKGEKLEAPSHTIDARIQSIVLTAQRRQASAAGDSEELDPVARSLLE